jgi:pyruvate,water dikinase
MARERARRELSRRRLLLAVHRPLQRWILLVLLSKARQAVAAREDSRFARTRLYGLARETFRHLGQRLETCVALKSASDIHYLTVDEVFGYLEGAAVSTDLSAVVSLRKAEYERFTRASLPSRFETVVPPALATLPQGQTGCSTDRHLRGTGCCIGQAEGKAAIMVRPDGRDLSAHPIIVTESTDPSWAFILINASGIVVERGSVLSHTAIVGRELGIPTVVNVPGATRLIPPWAQLRIDGGSGEVAWT